MILFLVAVGVWGMVIFKTGRLQKSIDMDIDRFKKVKHEDLPNDLKLKADYLNKV
jgi:hypothetical protein